MVELSSRAKARAVRDSSLVAPRSIILVIIVVSGETTVEFASAINLPENFVPVPVSIPPLTINFPHLDRACRYHFGQRFPIHLA